MSNIEKPMDLIIDDIKHGAKVLARYLLWGCAIGGAGMILWLNVV